MYRLSYRMLFLLLAVFTLAACKQQPTLQQEGVPDTDAFSIRNFRPVTNMQPDKDNRYVVELDYTEAMTKGFEIPTIRQNKDGYLICTFEIRNKGKQGAAFSYKIYYQNESYKIPELQDDGKTENPLTTENFYGSWEQKNVLFKSTPVIPADGEYHTVTDSIRIVGNPRNEVRYFENGKNDRWKRNPRVGAYSFLLVAVTPENISNKQIPAEMADISLSKDGVFSSPYYYFLYGKGHQLKNVGYLKADSALHVRAHPNLGSGVYINPENFSKEAYAQFFTNGCGQDTTLYNSAPFEQFINYIDPSMRFENIPVVRDVTADDYTQTDYNWDRAFYKRNELISTLPCVAQQPCQTVYSDAAAKKIVLRNPATKEGVWRKESVGVRTRHGFTYGKYRLKCKLAELLNKNNVWNGMTNAIWLLNQQKSGEWNNRRACQKKGYMATYWGGENDKRVPLTTYSEIDFELIKTYPYCPQDMYPPLLKTPISDQNNVRKWNVKAPEEVEAYKDKITVTCTNWDMACWDPVDFNVGCNEIVFDGVSFPCHRWSENYRALSERKYESDAELFGSEYYYFEIDWRPTEIIWRIGPSPDKMHLVGFVNDRYTAIPNNQMTMIVTQEYHNTKWWPGSPFIQENIPFPSKDIIGEIYELVIE